jgi:hypothetical protein
MDGFEQPGERRRASLHPRILRHGVRAWRFEVAGFRFEIGGWKC